MPARDLGLVAWMEPSGHADGVPRGAIRERRVKQPRISQELHPGYGIKDDDLRQPVDILVAEIAGHDNDGNRE
jgi:hypothetical protein